MPGIKLHHKTVKSGLVLVPLLDKPLYIHHKPVIGKDECPTCQQIHMVKTVHLTFDSNGSCIVSQGVLDLLKSAEPSPIPTEMYTGVEIKNPPNLTVDGERTRAQIDYENLRQQFWGQTYPAS